MKPSAQVLGSLQAALRSVRPRRADLRPDAVAALPGAISTVPDGMACAVLVGVNPAYGLFAGFAGPIGGGLTTSTRLMVVTTTTAAALAAGSALEGLPEDRRDSALILLTVMAGLLMTAAGLLRLGRYVRFVSRSVMLGFLTGVAVKATLTLPVAAAVGVGVLVSLLLQLNRDALDLRVVRLEAYEDALVETEAPDVLPDREPVVLDVYGSLLYAGARTLEARLPDPSDADKPVVILRLRGRTSLGSTFFSVVAAYAASLHDRDGVLYLSGVDQQVLERFQRTQSPDTRDVVRVFEARPVVGESTLAALSDANAWLVTPSAAAR